MRNICHYCKKNKALVIGCWSTFHVRGLGMKACKRCFREFGESKVDVVGVNPATELVDILDSRFHGNDREDRGNDRGEADIGVEDINDLCPQCREELGVMDLLGFGL